MHTQQFNNGTTRNLIKDNIAIAIAWDYTYFKALEDGIVFKPVEDMCEGIDIYLIENSFCEPSSKTIEFKKYLLEWFKLAEEKRNL
ncbi:MAG: hypothetical protein Q4B70_15315 [Lachnospiraceae bacterium]|nr:hypothetical protein [Lachnospiraceae bacterium]